MANKNFKLDKRKLEIMIATEPATVDGILRETSIMLVGDMQTSMGSSPAGNVYRRGKKTHVASQPGYPPNVDTGRLRASLKWRKLRAGEYEISDGVEYGYGLEVGTARVKARPFMRPAFERARKWLIERIQAGMV